MADLAYLKFKELAPREDNLREQVNVNSIKQLAISISQSGLKQPLNVSPNGGDTYNINAGHRRYAAIGMLLDGTVPFDPATSPFDADAIGAIIEEQADDSNYVVTMLIENLQREDLDAIEEARGYQRLLSEEFGLTQKGAAAKIGRSGAHISRRLALLTLPESAHMLIRAGELGIADAYDLSKIEDNELIESFVNNFDDFTDPSSEIHYNLGRQEREHQRKKVADHLEQLGMVVVDSKEEIEAPDGKFAESMALVSNLDELPKSTEFVRVSDYLDAKGAVQVIPYRFKKYPEGDVTASDGALGTDSSDTPDIDKALRKRRKLVKESLTERLHGTVKKDLGSDFAYRMIFDIAGTKSATAKMACTFLGVEGVEESYGKAWIQPLAEFIAESPANEQRAAVAVYLAWVSQTRGQWEEELEGALEDLG